MRPASRVRAAVFRDVTMPTVLISPAGHLIVACLRPQIPCGRFSCLDLAGWLREKGHTWQA